jgi:hypothetical protein
VQSLSLVLCSAGLSPSADVEAHTRQSQVLPHSDYKGIKFKGGELQAVVAAAIRAQKEREES